MLPEVLEVLHELIDAVAVSKGISDNRRAELHAKLDQATAAEPEPEPEAADVPPGA